MTKFKNVLLVSFSVSLFLGGITLHAQDQEMAAPEAETAEVSQPVPVQPIQPISPDLLEEYSKNPEIQATVQRYLEVSPELAEICRANEGCSQLLPPDLQKGSKKPEPRLLTLKAGGAVQTKTGAGAALGFEALAPIQLIQPSLHGIRTLPIPVYGLIRADGIIGSTASQGTPVPTGKLELGANAQYHFDSRERGILGTRKAEVEATVALDRNQPLDRDWRVLAKLQAGVSLFGDPDDLKSNGHLGLATYVQAGVANSSDKILPNVIDWGTKVNGVACPWRSNNGKQAICLDGRVIGSAGLVQAGIEGAIGANYRTELSKADDAFLKQLSVGPELSGNANVDIAGPHSAAQGLLMITVK